MFHWIRFFAFLLSSLVVGATSGSLLAQEKVDPLANDAAIQNGKVRVIIVTRADIDQNDGGQSLGQSMGYVSSLLGGSGNCRLSPPR